MGVQEKWKANADKVAFMKRFPGLLTAWEHWRGKTIETVDPLPSRSGGAVLVATDGSFTVAPPLSPEPAELRDALAAARPTLERHHRDAYVEYDQLALKDRELTKQARLENILGAIQNNIESIPELKERIRELVKQWK
jgi:diglucosylglycerate octanoyltransferase